MGWFILKHTLSTIFVSDVLNRYKTAHQIMGRVAREITDKFRTAAISEKGQIMLDNPYLDKFGASINAIHLGNPLL